MATAPSELICAVDIGGTFTDSIIVTGSGKTVYGKVPTSRGDLFESGFFGSIESAAEKLGLSPDETFRQIRYMMHGSTVSTNSVVERRGARVGLLTTKGHEDAIIMMRGLGRVTGEPPENVLRVTETRKPDPLVPRQSILGITERMDLNGDVVVDLNEGEVRQAVQDLLDQGVEAFAISYLWSFKNAAHEMRTKEIVQELAPGSFVTCASEVSKTLGEYERTVAAVINAYVGPITSRYLDHLHEGLRTRGFQHSFDIMLCHGGMVPLQQSKELPVLTIGSGPVGGVMGSAFIMNELNVKDLILTDMGGTSFDVGLIRDGQPLTADQAILHKYQYNAHNIEIISIGAGGGSIAWIEPYSGSLRVGPQSAGATPGPACYGVGGTEPTVTDAVLLLGYIDPGATFGSGRVGGIRPDKALAEKAIRRVAEPLGLTPVEAAQGIVEIINSKMANLIENEVIGRGFDPRDFALISYGGAGPIHAAAYARNLGISLIVVPGETASVWSAFGIATSDIRYHLEEETTLLSPIPPADLHSHFEGLERQGRELVDLTSGHEGKVVFQRFAKIRYQWQRQSLEVPVPEGELDEEKIDAVLADFTKRYEERYSSAALLPEARYEIESLRVEPIVSIPKPYRERSPLAGETPPDGARRADREVYFPGARESVRASIWDGTQLQAGNVIEGPAVVDLPTTSIVLEGGQSARKTEFADYILTV
jgi:N-methylhydantoinase A